MVDGKPKTQGDETRETAGKEPVRSLTEDEIVTQRRLPRRLLLTTAGTFLAAGSLVVVSGARALSQEPDPDKPKSQDPDKPKSEDPDKPKSQDPDKPKSQDPDKPKSQDPDKPKSEDPDKAKSEDPDKAK